MPFFIKLYHSSELANLLSLTSFSSEIFYCRHQGMEDLLFRQTSSRIKILRLAQLLKRCFLREQKTI